MSVVVIAFLSPIGPPPPPLSLLLPLPLLVLLLLPHTSFSVNICRLLLTTGRLKYDWPKNHSINYVHGCCQGDIITRPRYVCPKWWLTSYRKKLEEAGRIPGSNRWSPSRLIGWWIKINICPAKFVNEAKLYRFLYPKTNGQIFRHPNKMEASFISACIPMDTLYKPGAIPRWVYNYKPFFSSFQFIPESFPIQEVAIKLPKNRVMSLFISN